MADLLYSWAKLEQNLKDGDVGFFHGTKTKFNKHKNERSPEYIWLVRQDKGHLWLLGKLFITAAAPKNRPSDLKPDNIFYDPMKSFFFADVLTVSRDTEQILTVATRSMRKSNWEGSGAEDVLEPAEQNKLELKTRQAKVIPFYEFKELIESGNVPTPPYRLPRASNKPSAASVKPTSVEASSNNASSLDVVAVSDKTHMSSDESSDDRGSDWVVSEVDLIVSEYFALLAIEAKQGELNKAARCSELITKLNGRSKGSIEFKFQNISAVLLDLGQPFIRGYKPLGNYQKLLRERTTEFMIGNRKLIEEIFQDYESSLPDGTTEILTKVDPPVVGTGNPDGGVRQRFPRKLDFPALDEQNRTLGQKGEEWVIRYEQQRLRDSGWPNLADQIEWTSQEKGDGTGYDIKSFNDDGSTRYIEVKTTNAGASTPFYVSKNEVDFSDEVGESFFIYRVFEFSTDPKFYELQGSLKITASLEATAYRARPMQKAESTAD